MCSNFVLLLPGIKSTIEKQIKVSLSLLVDMKVTAIVTIGRLTFPLCTSQCDVTAVCELWSVSTERSVVSPCADSISTFKSTG